MKTYQRFAVIGFGLVLGFTAGPAVAQQAPRPGNADQPANAPVVTQDQFQQELHQLMQDLDDPNYDTTKLPPRVRQVFQDFRSVSQAMDPDQAQAWRMQVFQQFMPVMQRNQAKIQKAMQMAFLLDLKVPLGATDDEFDALLPALEKVANALRESQGGMARFRNFGQRNGQGQPTAPQSAAPLSPVDQASVDLQTALDDPNSSADLIKTKLDVLRQAKSKANQDLFEARNELRSMLTVRQEAILLDRGLMD